MSWYRVAVWLVSSLAATQAQAFIDPPVISPDSPTDTTPITISIRTGICDRFLSYEIIRDLDPVEILIRRIPTQLDPFCNHPIRTVEIPIGVLPVGPHLIRLMFVDNVPPNTTPYLWRELALKVSPSGPPAEVVPVSILQDVWPLLVLGVLIFLVVARRHVWDGRMNSLLVFALALALTPQGEARTYVEVLLAAGGSAPTPEAVVAWGRGDPAGAPGPLQALNAAPFSSVDYFIPEWLRAGGDFKATLDAYPNSPQALLERFVIVEYPDGSNLEKALDAFAEDPHVLAYAVMEEYRFSGVTLQSFGIEESTQAEQ